MCGMNEANYARFGGINDPFKTKFCLLFSWLVNHDMCAPRALKRVLIWNACLTLICKSVSMKKKQKDKEYIFSESLFE